MSARAYKDLGVVRAIALYPVKSMQGQLVDAAKLGFAGLACDREYAFLREQDTTGLPWLSARQCPRLLRYAAAVEDVGERHAAVVIRTPDGEQLDIRDPRLLAEIIDLAGEPLRLVRVWRRTYDSAGAEVSIITTQSIQAIADIAERPLEPARFRPNVVVEATAEAPFREDKWVGSSVAIGDGGDPARLRLTRKDPRCRIVALDPHTGDEDPRIHKIIVGTRKNNLGVYATVERTGAIAEGQLLRQRVNGG
jgi:uncharacterized protein YcbX